MKKLIFLLLMTFVLSFCTKEDTKNKEQSKKMDEYTILQKKFESYVGKELTPGMRTEVLRYIDLMKDMGLKAVGTRYWDISCIWQHYGLCCVIDQCVPPVYCPVCQRMLIWRTATVCP